MIKNFKDTVLRIVREWVIGTVETTLPGIVVSIDNYETTQQIAIVQPLINLFFDDNQAVEMPFLYNVPVELIGTKESLFSVPIKVGDTVTLKFSKRSLDELKEQATAMTYTPKDRRWFDTNDAVAFPTILNKSSNLSPSKDHVEIKHKDITVSYQDSGDIVETNSEVTKTYTASGDITVVNSNANLNISPDGVLTYSSGPVSLVLSPNSNSLTVTAANTSFSGNVNIQGNLGVSGSTSLSGAVTNNGKDIGDTHIHAHGIPNTSPPL